MSPRSLPQPFGQNSRVRCISDVERTIMQAAVYEILDELAVEPRQPREERDLRLGSKQLGRGVFDQLERMLMMLCGESGLTSGAVHGRNFRVSLPRELRPRCFWQYVAECGERMFSATAHSGNARFDEPCPRFAAAVFQCDADRERALSRRLRSI